MYAALYKLLALLNLDWPYLLVSEYKIYVKSKVYDSSLYSVHVHVYMYVVMVQDQQNYAL